MQRVIDESVLHGIEPTIPDMRGVIVVVTDHIGCAAKAPTV